MTLEDSDFALVKLRRLGQRSRRALTFVKGKVVSQLFWSRYPLSPRLHDLGLELTFRCNLSCVMCPLAKEKGLLSDTVELTADDWEDFIDEVASFSKPEVTLTGAEPMLYEGWDRVAAYCRKMGLTVTIQTNGTFLEKHVKVIPFDIYGMAPWRLPFGKSSGEPAITTSAVPALTSICTDSRAGGSPKPYPHSCFGPCKS